MTWKLEYNHFKPTPVVEPLSKHLWAIGAILLTRTRSVTWPITESLQEEIKTDDQRESRKIENLIGLVSREPDIIGQRGVKKRVHGGHSAVSSQNGAKPRTSEQLQKESFKIYSHS